MNNLPKPAPQRLIISNLHFERKANQSVKVLTTEGMMLATILRKDWSDVANFFRDISEPGRKL